MLRIHPVTSASGAKSYYQASDYYSEGTELAGKWGGELAAKLGLSGVAEQEAFERLCDNLHPLTGKPLTPRTNADRRVGYDMVFSAPKSFSVLEALIEQGEDGENALRHFFRDSVRETMGEIEADMQTRVRKGDAFHDRPTGNLVYTMFEHSTARAIPGQPPDMHRHEHVLCFNATYDPVEKRIKAGEFSRIKRDGEYYTAAFYSRLAGKLEAAGYRIDRKGGKEWEIAGVPQTVIDRFSKRTDQVEEEAKRRGETDAGRKAELGAKTRSRKSKELSPGQLRAAWDGQLTPAEREALGRVYRGEVLSGPEVSAREAVAYAVAHCFERLSVVPERELKRVAMLQGLGCVTAADIRAELPAQGVIVREKGGRAMATTRQALEEERFYAGIASEGLGSVRPVGVPEDFARGRLNDGQFEAVRGLLATSNRVSIVQGPAGTGKSTMLQAYDQAMRSQGRHVTYLATTTAAVDVLRADGFQAETVAHFLMSEKAQAAAHGGHVVVDESSLLSHKDAFRLFKAVQGNDLKLTLLGDAMQHGSVAAGSTLKVLEEHGGVVPLRLTEVIRQKSALYRRAIEALSEGRTLEGFDALDKIGFVKENRIGDRYHAIGAEYLQALEDKKSVLVVSPTHAEGERMSGEIRRQLRHAGRLGKKEQSFTRLVATNLTEAERGDARNFKGGEVLQFHQNSKRHKKGDRLVVAEGDAGRALVPITDAAKFQAYRQEEISLASGDLLRFTSNIKSLDNRHKIANGSTYRIEGFTPGGNIRLENGWIVDAAAGHFQQGYVVTSFGSQGRTVDRVIIGQATASLAASNREQIYVSASRARERMTLYTDDKAAVREAIQRSSLKLSATELVEGSLAKPNASASGWDRLRRQAERLRRTRLLDRLRHAVPSPERHPEKERAYGR